MKLEISGISWEEVAKRAPPGIEVACHNYADVTTISGPTELIDEFLNQLNGNKIFGRQIPSAGFAFHSSYIAEAGQKFLEKLKKVSANFIFKNTRRRIPLTTLPRYFVISTDHHKSSTTF